MTTVAKELRRIKGKKRKDLERLAVLLAAAESDEEQTKLVQEISELGKWFSDAKAYGRAACATNSGHAAKIKAQNKKSGLSAIRKSEVSGGGPGTGKRR